VGEFEDEIRARLEGNIIPFKPLAEGVSTDYIPAVDTPEDDVAKRPTKPPTPIKPPTDIIASLDDERQRRFREQFMPAIERAEPLPCGTPFLRGRPIEPLPPDLLVPKPKRLSWPGVGISALSLALFSVSVFFNGTFWRGLATTSEAGWIMAILGGIVETINYTLPSALSAVSGRGLRAMGWGLVAVAMTTVAIASTSFVRANLGATEASRQAIAAERARLEAILSAPMSAQSSDGVAAAKDAVETAKANQRTDCPRYGLDLDRCGRAKVAVVKAQDGLAAAIARHDASGEAAATRSRDEREKASAALAALPVISADRNVLLAGVSAIVPFASEGVVNGLVAGLWVALFCFGPCVLLRVGLALRR
jgi:hypothetical protein